MNYSIMAITHGVEVKSALTGGGGIVVDAGRVGLGVCWRQPVH